MSRTTSHSELLYKQACELMPGGVSSPVRAFRSVGGTPVYFKRAAGQHFFDEDNNRYTDYCLSWGPLILGHAYPEVVTAVQRAAADGLSFGACCRQEVELAQLLLSALPGCEQVRFVCSGTEAVMTALRLARGATGRTRILKFSGGYHGHTDALLVSAGSGLATFGTASSKGVSQALANETIVCPLDDDDALESVFAQYGDTLAAAIIEPLPANNGLLVQRPQWLRRLRELTRSHGALLILDEVISGLRLHFGTYGDALDIQADLITLGKIVGGGMPVGAVAGPRRLLEQLAPLGDVYQAGTLAGNPVSLAAGIATLKVLAQGEVYTVLEQLGAQLEAQLAARFAGAAEVQWQRVGSVFWIYLDAGEMPRRAEHISPQAATRFAAIHEGLLGRGIYLAPSAYEVGFLSVAHTREDVAFLAESLERVLSR